MSRKEKRKANKIKIIISIIQLIFIVILIYSLINIFLWYNIIDKKLKGAKTSWHLHFGWRKFQKQ